MDIYDIENAKNFEEIEELIYPQASVNFHNMIFDDMLNGDGLRLTIFFSGCPEHCKDEKGNPCHCKECHNPQTWSKDSGIPFTEWEEAEFWGYLKDKPWLQGVTFTGGEPLAPYNRKKIGEMSKMLKKLYPDKDIWLYTGYTLINEDNTWKFTDDNTDAFELDFIEFIDVLVDGRFECETRRSDIANNHKVIWRGSSNQRVINVPETIKQGQIVRKYE